MYQSDFHLHTDNSFDSKTPMAEVCLKAISRGFSEICFTEHFTLNPNVPTYGHLDWDLYNGDIRANRAQFGDRLQIRKGIELCSPHRDLQGYRALFAEEGMDFIVGSIHDVGDRKLRFLLRDLGKEAGYAKFFAETLAMAGEADIDCLAHIDLIKRYQGEPFGPADMEQYGGILSEILRTIIRRGIALEINTSTLERLGQTMPDENILSLYRELGGTLLSFGSDSHTGSSVGGGFGYARSLARKCGFTSYCTYEGRVPVIREIPE